MGLNPAPPPNLSEDEKRLWFQAIGVLYGNCPYKAGDKTLPLIASLHLNRLER